ncbi:MAG: aminopeptidase P family N-terminal domain-containing protein [Bacteroidales bacterium]|nr:aminopeptidase P family N-terminal domain-containing protein [Candidatus Colicola faecequi]
MTVIEKLAALRKLMQEHGLSAYIVPGTDPHASEYMAAHWTETTWLSGFTGEAGTMVVTLKEAKLFTDSRYYLQAGIELKDSTIELMRASDIDCPSINDWLISTLEQGAVVGVNPEMWSVNEFAGMGREFAEAGMGLKSVDLIRPLWTEDRPSIPLTPLYEYEVRFAGESVADKVSRIRKAMAQKKADAMVISALDEIAWLLNIRGYDVEYNPVVISYVVLEKEQVTLFVLPEKVDAAAAAYLKREGICVKDYEAVFAHIAGLKGTVMYDGAKVNEALYEAIPEDCRKVNVQSPVLKDKSHKNAIELEGERKAMLQDSVALTRFFKWLEEEAFRTPQTEWTLMEKLHEYRLMGENFVEESFGTIAGYKGNGAIVHYAATADNCAEVKPEGMLLLDSGGQYLDGTTDITRTVWLGGEMPQQAKLDYTYVLKGHLALGHIQWPRGTRGNQLDALAKQAMWQAGITFGHGTGHGVGHFLGCHEGPQNVRTDMNPTVLEAGQICSDEPGIYRTGEWGIRIENLVAVEPAPRMEACTTEDEFLRWETLTLCYYDTTLIEMSIMTPQEIEWINRYHQKVYELTAPLLTAEEAAWLKNKCKAI